MKTILALAGGCRGARARARRFNAERSLRGSPGRRAVHVAAVCMGTALARTSGSMR